MPPRYGLRSQKNPATPASMADQSDHSNQAAAAATESPVTMRALQAMMDSFKLEMRAMGDRMNSKIAESRSRPSSAIPPTPQAPPQSDSPATVTQQQPSPAKKRRNQKTRKQYKRKKALHVTVQPSVKEVEHTVRVKHGNKPGKHVVLQRSKLVPRNWSTTSLWCWYAVISWDGMTMVLLRCRASGMSRLGIGWSQQRSDGPYLNELEPSEVLVPQPFRCCIYSILDPSVGNHQIPESQWDSHQLLALRFLFSQPACVMSSQLASEIAARTLAFFQKGGICYGTYDHMGAWLVMTSLGARFSVLSWPTHLGSWTTNIHHTHYWTTLILSLNTTFSDIFIY